VLFQVNVALFYHYYFDSVTINYNSDNSLVDGDEQPLFDDPSTRSYSINMSRGGGFRGRGRGGPPGMSAFNQRDYMEAMQKTHKHGGMLYPVCLVDIQPTLWKLISSHSNRDSWRT
jgi:hypothetical protein